jgi:hypothetical protein
MGMPAQAPQETAAWVNGRPISVAQVEARAEEDHGRTPDTARRKQLDALRKGTRDLAWHLDNLISEEVLAQESVRLGVRVTEDDVREEAARLNSPNLENTRRSLLKRRVLDHEVRFRFALDGDDLQQLFERWLGEAVPSLYVLTLPVGTESMRPRIERIAASFVEQARRGRPLCDVAAAATVPALCTGIDPTNWKAADIVDVAQWLDIGETVGPVESRNAFTVVQLLRAKHNFGTAVQGRYLALEMEFQRLDARWTNCLRLAANIIVNPRIGLPARSSTSLPICRRAY